MKQKFTERIKYLIAVILSLLNRIVKVKGKEYDVVLLFTGSVGDYILNLNSLETLAKHFENQKMLFICQKCNANGVKSIRLFDEYLFIDSLRKTFRSLLGLRASKVIYFGISRCTQFDIISKIINAPEKIVYNAPNYADRQPPNCLNRIYTDILPSIPRLNHTLLHVSCAVSQIIGQPRDAKIADLRSFVGKPIVPGSYFVVAPSCASFFGKSWYPERFAALAQYCADKTGLKCVITGTDADIRIEEEIAGRLNCECVKLCGKTAFSDLFSVIGHAAFFIGNDSGTSHLAAALRVDGLSICCDGWGESYLPYPPGSCTDVIVGTVKHSMPCHWCLAKSSRIYFSDCLDCLHQAGRYLCIDKITVEDAITELNKTGILEKYHEKQ